MREKLIELLKEAERRNIDEAIPMTMEQREKLLSDGDGYGFYADHLIANGVVVSKMETTTKWIPVTERLPEKEGRYLCVVRIGKSGAVYVQVMNGDSYGFSLNHIYTDDVTHWMPLPEPPKGE